MPDAPIYNSGGVIVNKDTITISGTIYSVANINSVTVRHIPDPKAGQSVGCGCLSIVAALILLLAILGSFTGENAGNIPGYLVFGIGFAALGVWLLRKKQPPGKFELQFQMSSGQISALSSDERDHVARVQRAIEQAMRERASTA